MKRTATITNQISPVERAKALAAMLPVDRLYALAGMTPLERALTKLAEFTFEQPRSREAEAAARAISAASVAPARAPRQMTEAELRAEVARIGKGIAELRQEEPAAKPKRPKPSAHVAEMDRRMGLVSQKPSVTRQGSTLQFSCFPATTARRMDAAEMDRRMGLGSPRSRVTRSADGTQLVFNAGPA